MGRDGRRRPIRFNHDLLKGQGFRRLGSLPKSGFLGRLPSELLSGLVLTRRQRVAC